MLHVFLWAYRAFHVPLTIWTPSYRVKSHRAYRGSSHLVQDRH